MTLTEQIAAIDAQFIPDPDASIDAIGTTADGREIDLEIINVGNGAYVYPGASFLPYGGIVWNPVIVSIREGLLRR